MKLAPPAAAALAACGALLGWSCAARPAPRAVVPLRAATVGAVEIYGPGLVATDDSGETVTFVLQASAGVTVLRVWPGWRVEPLYPIRDRDTAVFHPGTHVLQVPRPVPWDTLALRPSAAPGGQGAREQAAEQCISSSLEGEQPQPAPRRTADTTGRAQVPPRPPAYVVDRGAIEARCRALAGLTDSAPVPRDTLLRHAREYYLMLVASDVAQDAGRLRVRLAGMDITHSSVFAVLHALPAVLAGPAARSWATYVAYVR